MRTSPSRAGFSFSRHIRLTIDIMNTFVYSSLYRLIDKRIDSPISPLEPPSGRYRGTVAAPKAESADEPGSRDGILEITSRKGGKLQRPVKPEKQGADVSRKTGSHDGPERGWPREPRGSLEGPRCLFVLSRDGPPGAFKGTSSLLSPRETLFFV